MGKLDVFAVGSAHELSNGSRVPARRLDLTLVRARSANLILQPLNTIIDLFVRRPSRHLLCTAGLAAADAKKYWKSLMHGRMTNSMGRKWILTNADHLVSHGCSCLSTYTWQLSTSLASRSPSMRSEIDLYDVFAVQSSCLKTLRMIVVVKGRRKQRIVPLRAGVDYVSNVSSLHWTNVGEIREHVHDFIPFLR